MARPAPFRHAARLAAMVIAAGLAATGPGAAAPDWAPPGWAPAGAPGRQAAEGPVVVAARPVPMGAVLTEADIRMSRDASGGGIPDMKAVLGQEARVALYAGRPIRPGDVGPPALVDRNDLVQLRFSRGPLLILAEGRALGRGAQGERIQVMNLGSRQTVTGVVAPDGAVEVSP